MAVHSRVDADVVAAILAGSSRVTRRLEICESDGETIWMPSAETPRMIDGSVSVDYSRAERRSVDLTLDNSDGVLVHSPEGFWYDKILKIYRGVEFPNLRRQPAILVIEEPANFLAVAPMLRVLGFVDVTVNTSVTTVEQMYGYDIIVANGNIGVITKGAILAEAYAAGYQIMTFGLNSTSAEIPLISATVAKSDAATWTVNRYTAVDNYLKDSWTNFSLAFITHTGRHVTAVTTGTKIVGTWTNAGNPGFTALLQENTRGSRWFHFQPPPWPTLERSMRVLMKNAVTWLYGYNDLRKYEVQVGEFMIDQINESYFPRTIQVTGRDYTKKLLRSKFSNSTTFNAGLSLDSVVRAIAANAGVTKFVGGASGISVDSEITFARTDERWKAISDICTAAGVEVFFNPEGWLVTRQFLDPVTSPATVSLAVGNPNGNLVSYEKSSNDSRIYNRVIVTGEDAELLGIGVFFQAIAENNQPSSPTRIERLGQIDYFYTSAFFTTSAQCQKTADNFLSVMALEEFNLDFSSLVFPWIEAGDIAEFIDPTEADFPKRFLLTNFNIPLGLSAMSGTAKRVSIVGAPSTPGDTLFSGESL